MRFDPLSKPAASAMSIDDEEKEEKPMSAHQLRHMERKRLHKEAMELKQMKRGVSKADKISMKKERREIGKSLKVNRAGLRAASQHVMPAASHGAAAAPSNEVNRNAAPDGAAFKFDLPVPARQSNEAGIGTWPAMPMS